MADRGDTVVDNFNNNVFQQGHFESWNDKLGKNFTDNSNYLHKQGMIAKNIETGECGTTII